MTKTVSAWEFAGWLGLISSGNHSGQLAIWLCQFALSRLPEKMVLTIQTQLVGRYPDS